VKRLPAKDGVESHTARTPCWLRWNPVTPLGAGWGGGRGWAEKKEQREKKTLVPA